MTPRQWLTLSPSLALLVPLAQGCRTDRDRRQQPAPAAAKPADQRRALQQLAARIADPAAYRLTAARAERFAELTLHCQNRPYPNKPSHVYERPAEIRPPRELTPAFYGCFDWHSAVHGHWTLVRLLSRFGDSLAGAERMRAVLRAHLDAPPLAAERAFFAEARNRLFERPYGWAWLMRLQAELASWTDAEAEGFSRNLAPLVALLKKRTASYLQRLSAPVRAGTHKNTAFAMTHMLDYARTVDDRQFAGLLARRARDYFAADRDCPTAYEPSGEDFISPCLVEADLMRRVLSPKDFVAWLGRFLPPLTSRRFAPLRSPPEVRDAKDPRIGHLIGLSLQRAWSLEAIASALPASDPRRPVLRKVARVHRHHALSKMFDSGYGGAHWLASFAVYLLTGAGSAQPPADQPASAGGSSPASPRDRKRPSSQRSMPRP